MIQKYSELHVHSKGLVDLKGLDSKLAKIFSGIIFSSLQELFPGFPERKITWDYINNYKIHELKSYFSQKIKELKINRLRDIQSFFNLFKNPALNDLFGDTYLYINVDIPETNYLAEAEQAGKEPHFYYIIRINILNILERFFEEINSVESLGNKLKIIFAHELRHIVDFIYKTKGPGRLDSIPKSEEEYYNLDTEMKSYAGDVAQKIFQDRGYTVENANIIEDLKKYPAFTKLNPENKKNFLTRVYREIQKLKNSKI